MVLLDKPIFSPDDSFIIGMIAGEASGDTLGAALMKSLQSRYPHATFAGIGGPKMIALGFQSWYPMEKLSVMGFFEPLKHLFELLKIRKSVISRFLAIKPDVFIGVDAPDFNFKVESELKKNGITAIHYVGPSVWAWREKRLEKIHHSVDGVLVLFPFEPPYYHRYDIPVKFVGHPLANQIPEKPDVVSARSLFEIEPFSAVTAILPGSRMSEVNRMADVYIQSAKLLADIYPKMQFLIPCVHNKAKARIQEAVDRFGKGVNIVLVDGQSRQVLEACDQALVTSGTATLESALMKKPLVLAIKVHPVSYWIMKRLATTQWIGLPNILANQSLVSELIQNQATPHKIAIQMGRLIMDTQLRAKQIEAFEKQYALLKQDASELAADAIEDWANLKGKPLAK